ncbi:MAG: TetR family transcriptional regulator [Oscillospiraceae bacterium]|nr:TetR family transcriptional regulator [Oscillospiraceae bacterium]
MTNTSIIRESTKEKLLQTGINLFSRYGFEATTTRMIAEDSGQNLATMPFHFKNKENFYKAVLKYAAQDVSEGYEPFYTKIQELNLSGSWTVEKAWTCICDLVDIQLYISIDLPHPEYLTLIYWEQYCHFDNYTPITDVILLKSEETLAFLLTKYQPGLEYDRALLLSRIINGGIVSFGEHPMFVKPLKEKLSDKQRGIWMKNKIREFVLKSIQEL